MNVFNINIPNKSLTNIELEEYAKQLGIPHFRGVFMRDQLPTKVNKKECGIVNLNTSQEPGSHWVCYYKNNAKDRIYFDSFGQITPVEVQKYLKTKNEFAKGESVIKRNTDIVQDVNTHICGHLCLFVLKSLSNGSNFQEVINTLTRDHVRYS